MRQRFLGHFPGLRVHHRNRLLSRVQIAAYNPHLGLLRPELCALDSTQFTRIVVRPTLLCHQTSVGWALNSTQAEVCATTADLAQRLNSTDRVGVPEPLPGG